MYCSKCGKQVDTSTRFCPDCGNDLSSLTNAGKTTPLAAQPPQENETDIVREGLKDEYELEKELGRGGMAVVYKARDKQLDREVAIKVLPFSLSFDAEFVERFQREARTAGKLEHPNIIPIYRVGRSGRVIYFVMKFIRGKSLSAVIERGAMPVSDIKRFLTEAARALGYAHKHGIVHRDIKPDNIMFDELGQAIVADFGIAKASSGAKLTGTGMSIGTPHYMSPEQARAQNLDGRSDIYSLGVVAYQALTGHVPFDGEDSFSIGYKHIMEELPMPSLEQPDQQALFVVVQKMMAKKPDDRWQSAEELITAIEGVEAGVDMATMRTLAMPPMKAPARPAPPMTSAPTTPLPRASVSMGKPAEKDETKASPARPSAQPAKPSFKPKEITPKKSYAVPIGIAAALVLVGGGLGGYVMMHKSAATTDSTGLAVNTPPTPTPVDSHPAADTSKAAAPRDTAKAPTPAPTVTAPTTATTKQPSRRERDREAAAARAAAAATAKPPARTPAATQPVATPAVTGTGTISLGGNIPAGARIMLDGQDKAGSRRFKIPAGQHTLEITAQGYQPYTNRLNVAPNATQSVAVTMATAAAPTTTTTTTTPGAPVNAAANAICATPNGSRANPRKACYDTPPIPNTPTVFPPPASCTGNVSPANLLVQVSAQGEVLGTPSVSRGSNCPAFNAQAVAQIQEITFTAAKKGGVPVMAWRIIQMSPLRQ